MASRKTLNPDPNDVFLGIEGGGTSTKYIFSHGPRLSPVARTDACNLRLVSDPQLTAILTHIAKQLPGIPSGVGFGLPGLRTAQDSERVKRIALQLWPDTRLVITNDLETVLATAEWEIGPCSVPRIVVLSGTGSCCFGKNLSGEMQKSGGWGQLLGDNGSGYQIGLLYLRELIQEFDRSRPAKFPDLPLLNLLGLNRPDELIHWAGQASKTEVSSLSKRVFSQVTKRNRIALKVVGMASTLLAEQAFSCGSKLSKSGNPVQFIFAGGNLYHSRYFRDQVKRKIQAVWSSSDFYTLKAEPVFGALALVRKVPDLNESATLPGEEINLRTRGISWTQPSPTELRNPRSLLLDKMPTVDAVELMLKEEQRVPAALIELKKKIAQVVQMAVRTLRSNGRLFYVGAGTSGRLGVLDASECPPTFRSKPEQIQGIIAGGDAAIRRAVEGAEDDWDAGAMALTSRQADSRDLIIGIAASGRTPFVWGALEEAKRLGAKTVLITFTPYLRIKSALRPDIVLAPLIGPEILTGSTRLKAGTATKLILNTISTLTMVRLGKVVSNLMVDLNPSNVKLRERAVRIVSEVSRQPPEICEAVLRNNGWEVKAAIKSLARP